MPLSALPLSFPFTGSKDKAKANLLKHNSVPVHKTSFMKTGFSNRRILVSYTETNPFGINWNIDCNPGLLTQHHCSEQWIGTKSRMVCSKSMTVIGKWPQTFGKIMYFVHITVHLCSVHDQSSKVGPNTSCSGKNVIPCIRLAMHARPHTVNVEINLSPLPSTLPKCNYLVYLH